MAAIDTAKPTGCRLHSSLQPRAITYTITNSAGTNARLSGNELLVSSPPVGEKKIQVEARVTGQNGGVFTKTAEFITRKKPPRPILENVPTEWMGAPVTVVMNTLYSGKYSVDGGESKDGKSIVLDTSGIFAIEAWAEQDGVTSSSQTAELKIDLVKPVLQMEAKIK